jgi:predicted glycosyltransferase
MKKPAHRLLIDIGHPAQVHCFKNIFWELTKEGFQIKVTIKDKEITKTLLDEYKIPYQILSKKKQSRFLKILELPLVMMRYAKLMMTFKPDIVLCRLSIHSVWLGRIFGAYIIALADTEHTKNLDYLTSSFVHLKLTGNSYTNELGANHYKFPSILEFLYLHPKRFTFDVAQIKTKHHKSKIAILRFVSWGAHHDIGESGISDKHKLELIQELKKKYLVLISSETELPAKLKAYQIDIPVSSMHHYIQHAGVYIGEGASMASEAACLGTPAYYINSLQVGYIEEQARFGLTKSFRNSSSFMREIKEDLSNNLSWYNTERYKNYISQQIDCTKLLTWAIQNAPVTEESINKTIDSMKNNE